MTDLTEHESVSGVRFFLALPGDFYSADGKILRTPQRGGLEAMNPLRAQNYPVIHISSPGPLGDRRGPSRQRKAAA